MRLNRSLALALALVVGACAPDAPDSPRTGTAQLDPIAYFTGRAEGRATLHKLVGAGETILVHSSGRSDGKGGVLLDQRIEEPGKSERTRHWHLVPTGGSGFAGTLTDANGPVVASVAGPRLDIAFPMNGGLKAKQVLVLRADGKTLDNRLTVTKFGLRLAYLDEVIVKTG